MIELYFFSLTLSISVFLIAFPSSFYVSYCLVLIQHIKIHKTNSRFSFFSNLPTTNIDWYSVYCCCIIVGLFSSLKLYNKYIFIYCSKSIIVILFFVFFCCAFLCFVQFHAQGVSSGNDLKICVWKHETNKCWNFHIFIPCFLVIAPCAFASWFFIHSANQCVIKKSQNDVFSIPLTNYEWTKHRLIKKIAKCDILWD